VIGKYDDRREPPSQNIALPAQSDGSIRTLNAEERRKVLQIEQQAKRRPNPARLVIALVALVIGGLTIWWANADAPRAHSSSLPR
jgi:hypothetical protein